MMACSLLEKPSRLRATVLLGLNTFAAMSLIAQSASACIVGVAGLPQSVSKRGITSLGFFIIQASRPTSPHDQPKEVIRRSDRLIRRDSSARMESALAGLFGTTEIL